jgi:hypothetical protein
MKLPNIESASVEEIGGMGDRQLRERLWQTRLDWADQIEKKNVGMQAKASGDASAWTGAESKQYAANLAALGAEQRRLMVEIAKRADAERAATKATNDAEKQFRERLRSAETTGGLSEILRLAQSVADKAVRWIDQGIAKTGDLMSGDSAMRQEEERKRREQTTQLSQTAKSADADYGTSAAEAERLREEAAKAEADAKAKRKDATAFSFDPGRGQAADAAEADAKAKRAAATQAEQDAASKLAASQKAQAAAKGPQAKMMASTSGGGSGGGAGAAVAAGVEAAGLAATGPLGATIAAVKTGIAALEMPAAVLKGAMDAAAEGLRTIGSVAKSVASNDGFGAIAAAGEGVAKALDNIPIVGGAFASAMRLATGGLNIFKDVLDSFADRGRELAKYNSGIAAEVAIANVERILADIAEANNNQDEYMDLIRAQAKMERAWQEAMQDLKKSIMPFLTTGAKGITMIVKILPELLKNMGGPFGAILGKFGEAISALDKIDKNTDDTADATAKMLDDMRANKKYDPTAVLKDLGLKGVQIDDKNVPDKKQAEVPPPLRR